MGGSLKRKVMAIAAMAFMLVARRVPAEVGQVGVPLESAVAQAGREYYLRHCASCHGFEGKGDGPVAPALSVKPTDLTAMSQRRNGEFPMDELGALIDGRKTITAHGPREMPVWGERFGRDFRGDPARDQVIRGEILMLLVYLQSIQR
jgi:mono/diheme cytochrome c family protein